MSTHTKSYYRPREVSALLGVPLSTLRYWEDEFVQFNPERTAKGHRRYTSDDVEMCRIIIHLLRDKGLSLEYAQKELNGYRKYPPRRMPLCRNDREAVELLSELETMITDNAHAEVRIRAVKEYLTTRNDG